MTDQTAQNIQTTIDDNPVVLFMKGSKKMPQCGFSSAVVNALSYLEVDFKDVDVLEDGELRDGIKTFSDWPTIPQLYIDGEFQGGSDIMVDMFHDKSLAEALNAQN